MTVLHARIECVRIDGRDLIHGIDLALPRGRWTAVVGPNGAGKSTLLRAIAGLQRCEGAVTLAGRPLHDWPARARARQLAWMGQQEGGADDLTAWDVVMLGRLPHRPWLAPPTAADQRAAEAAMRATQSWDWRERRLGSLSGGERQRVLLARALAVDAPLTLMDEPLTHLDPPHQAEWMALVRARVAAGHSIVSVLHELHLALQADHLVLMADGRIAHSGAPADPATHEALRRVFGPSLHIAQVEGRWVALPL
ncbi:ABC transporter ATP-binding protein [Roseateles saccharophilus]|uniref:Iron complex transport system ATP-binding protein n=1 Tax=Roseateles saccharophilus TaxID=304 RepID=A0A4R3UR77_ROSSA|nr:ABC transporter ATP-binding protein [Roseateles saccharophilus]MDG0833263.1 ABC transporter ATP-binding protein [Roseateles saccharophilus]TCU94386.1 iron complex transport system ATP-binding protein [Roseateles saccharophilus]